MIKILGILFGIFLLNSFVWGNINSDLNNFFDQFGSSANFSTPDVYNGQKAGYMTGGGLSLRNRVMNSKIATVNLPRFDAGCGGIDIYAGGFSFINGEQLIATLKSIGSSAKGYAFLLGLETVSPQTANTIKQLQSWANTINSIGINSCEAASQIVGAVWPANTMASQQICRSMGNKNSRFMSDYVAARHKCSTQSGYDSLMQDIEKNNEYGQLGDEYNIAWQAIQKQRFLSGQNTKDLAELFMSLMGTIVVRKEENTMIERWPSKIEDESFLKTLLEGGVAQGYTCGSGSKNKCLTVIDAQIKIGSKEAWLGKIKDILLNIQSKILNDQELDGSEKELLSKSRLPLYKIVNVLTAYKKGYCPIDLYQVADTVAMDLLIQYLREVSQIVREGCNHLRREQFFAAPIDDYLKELERIEQTIRYYETRAQNQMEREFQMMQKIELIENQIASELMLE